MFRFPLFAFFLVACLAVSANAQQTCTDGQVFNDDTGQCEVDTGGGGGGGGDGPDDGTTPKLIRFLTPEDRATFAAGTSVAPTGRSSLSFAQSLPLDINIILDRSGSMGRFLTPEERAGTDFRSGARLIDVAKEAVNSLISVLPDDAQVTIIDFASDVRIASTKFLDADGNGISDNVLRPAFGANSSDVPLRQLSGALLEDYVRTLAPSGETAIKDAMKATQGFLNSTVADYLPDVFDREIILLSDGRPTPDFLQRPSLVEQFIFGGFGDVTTVALPGIDPFGQQFLADLATNTSGQFLDFSTDPQAFLDAFTGDNGLLAGLTAVDITDPDGNTYAANLDALGNFMLDEYLLKQGDNVFSATARFSDGTTETVSLNLIGTGGSMPSVPLPASGLLLVGALGAGCVLRRRNARV